ncbi:MAG: WD40 repeat domain-containing protein, partial [Pirellulaceae bacterium]
SITTIAVSLIAVRWLLPPEAYPPHVQLIACSPVPGNQSVVVLGTTRAQRLRDGRTLGLWWQDWSTEPSTERLLCPPGIPTCFAIHPASGRLFMGDSAGGIVILPFPPRANRFSRSGDGFILGHAPQGQPCQLGCSRDGNLLVVRDIAGLAAWDVHPKKSFQVRWYRADSTLSSFVLDPGERTLVCGRLCRGQTEVVEIDVATGELRSVIAISPATQLIDMVLSHHGKFLAVVENTGRANLLERQAVADDWRPRSVPGLDDRDTRVACFAPRADWLITSDSSKRCFVKWDLKGEVAPWEFGFHQSKVTGCAFLNDDRLLSWGAGDTIRIWDVNEGTLDRCIGVGRGH